MDIITNIAPGRLTQSKMICIKDLVDSKLFRMPECRSVLLPLFCQEVKDKLESKEEVISSTFHQIFLTNAIHRMFFLSYLCISLRYAHVHCVLHGFFYLLYHLYLSSSAYKSHYHTPNHFMNVVFVLVLSCFCHFINFHLRSVVNCQSPCSSNSIIR